MPNVLTLDGTYLLPNAAIDVRNMPDLWLPASQSGSDYILPGTDGAVAARRYKTATTRTLELVISGERVVTGSPTTTAANLQANIAWLRTVCSPPATAAGTRAAVLTMPDGATLEGPVAILGLRFGEVVADARWALATLDLSIPAGELVVVP